MSEVTDCKHDMSTHQLCGSFNLCSNKSLYFERFWKNAILQEFDFELINRARNGPVGCISDAGRHLGWKQRQIHEHTNHAPNSVLIFQHKKNFAWIPDQYMYNALLFYYTEAWNRPMHTITKAGHLLTHWGWDKMAAILQTSFSNAFSWMKMFDFQLKFHGRLFLRVQLTIFQHWFR